MISVHLQRFLVVAAALLLLLPALVPALAIYGLSNGVYLVYILAGLGAVVALKDRSLDLSNGCNLLVGAFILSLIPSLLYGQVDNVLLGLANIVTLGASWVLGQSIASQPMTRMTLLLYGALSAVFVALVLVGLQASGFSYRLYSQYSDFAYKLNYLDFAMCAGTVALFSLSRPSGKVFDYVAFLFFTAAILVSSARFSIVFVVVLFAFYLLTSSGDSRRRPGDSQKAFVFKSILACSVVGFVVYGADTYLSGSLFRLGEIGGGGSSVVARESIIVDTLAGISSAPLSGWGFGSSEAVLRGTYPHNFLLQVWLESGLIAFVLATLLFCYLLALCVRQLLVNRAFLIVPVLFLYYFLSHMKSFDANESAQLFLVSGLAYAASKRTPGRPAVRRPRRSARRPSIGPESLVRKDQPGRLGRSPPRA